MLSLGTRRRESFVNEKSLSTAIAFLSLLALPLFLYAAAGPYGPISDLTFDITITVPDEYRISGMQDIVFGEYSGSGNLESNYDLCVYTNGPGSYRAYAIDNSALSPTGFSAQNPSATADVPYVVRWNDVTGTSGNTRLNCNNAKNVTGANTQSVDCSIGGNTANLLVRFTRANLQAAPGGTYFTTLTIVIEP